MVTAWGLRRTGITAVGPLAFFAAALVWSASSGRMLAAEGTGRIAGAVHADRGVVRGFRVKAKDVVNRITYTVYTKGGRYHVESLPPGTYEVRVLEPGFDSPVQKVVVAAGDTKQVDVHLTAKPPRDVQYVEFDRLYPPGADRDLMIDACGGCHGFTAHKTPMTEAAWRGVVNRMRRGPNWNNAPYLASLNDKDAETIIAYLARNFGANAAKRELKIAPLEVDEDAVSEAMFVEYDAPEWAPPAKHPKFVNGRILHGGQHLLHDAYISPVDGTIFYPSVGMNEIVQLNPRILDYKKRWKEFPVKGDRWPNVFMHGITMDQKGRVYWAEIAGLPGENGGHLGQLDPGTGEMTRHEIPTSGAMLQVVVDQKGNVWYNLVHGSALGKLDAKTGKISQWPTPTADASPYGLAVAPDGAIWTVGYAKHLVIKFDPVTQKYTEYKTPTQPSGPRRLGVDKDGIVWYGEYVAGKLGSLDPKTGKMTEWDLPYRFTAAYETWPDNRGSVWISDHIYNSLIRFDVNTKTFTYYPLPQMGSFAGDAGWSVPKVEIDKDGTLWFGSRGVPNIVAVHFKPKGNVAAKPPTH